MKSSILALGAAAGTAYASVAAYGQCGGIGWTGATDCVDGWYCKEQNQYYSQCVYSSGASSGVESASSAPVATSISVASSAPMLSSTLAASSISKASSIAAASSSPIISSFQVSSSAAAASTTLAKVVSTTASTSAYVASSYVPSSSAVSSSIAATSIAASSTAAASSSSSASATGKVKYAGINISGFDFGCDTSGDCSSGGYTDPGTSGTSQMSHFVNDDSLNAFRLPVGWQYLVGSTLGATLDSDFFTLYDNLVQGCLDVAELCIIDLHNYGRWNGEIVGQSSGSVTNAQLASVWSQLATKYKSNAKVAFGVMNEPHDLTSVSTWAETVQAAVTAIRQAGATSQMILLPGNDWTHASTFTSDGSGAALLNVTNLDGSTDNLVFDVHQYLDSDGSGTSTTCTTDNSDTFQSLATWLRTNGRQAFLSETGGSSDSTCLTDVCAQLQVLMSNSDVYLGWTGWAAGEFATSYALAETPSGSAGSYTDQEVVTKCIAGIFNSA